METRRHRSGGFGVRRPLRYLSHHLDLDDVQRRKFAASSLVLQAGDPSYEDPAATVDSHLASCREALNDCSHLMSQASEAFR